MSATADDRRPVLIAGARTAFLESAGLYSPLLSYELGAQAIGGLLHKVDFDRAELELADARPLDPRGGRVEAHEHHG